MGKRPRLVDPVLHFKLPSLLYVDCVIAASGEVTHETRNHVT